MINNYVRLCQNAIYDTLLCIHKKYMTKHVTSFVRNKGNKFSKKKCLFLLQL